MCQHLYLKQGLKQYTVDIKMQKKWKNEDILCSEEILSCKSFGNTSDHPYSWVYSENVDDQTTVGKQMMERMKTRKKTLTKL